MNEYTVQVFEDDKGTYTLQLIYRGQVVDKFYGIKRKDVAQRIGRLFLTFYSTK